MVVPSAPAASNAAAPAPRDRHDARGDRPIALRGIQPVQPAIDHVVEQVDSRCRQAKPRESHDRLDDRRRLHHPAREDQTGKAGEVLDPLSGSCRLRQCKKASQPYTGLNEQRIDRHVDIHVIGSCGEWREQSEPESNRPAARRIIDQSLANQQIFGESLGSPSVINDYIATLCLRQRELRGAQTMTPRHIGSSRRPANWPGSYQGHTLW